MASGRPLVSVVTPIFNGSKFIAQCITSVQKQTYDNWHYVIVDNCSTDDSYDICTAFARTDPRITVKRNSTFVPAIANHNKAFESISPLSTYCKLVSADDWLFPNCLETLVRLAEDNPSVGIVGSYRMNVHGVPICNLPLDRNVFDGKSICRLFLLGTIDSFWLPTAVLYRSDCVRNSQPFFPGLAPSADLEACLRVLGCTDYGFLHQILSYERIHEESISTEVKRLDSYLLDRIRILQEFGPTYLTSTEYTQQLDHLLSTYFNDVLAAGFVNFRGREFWKTHTIRLQELGYSLVSRRLLSGIIRRLTDLLFNPKQTVEKILRRT
jgi:glycosyltransferase involved in cell wall biosynthesis